ncbi:MAG: DUF2606 family protein [Halobacteriota archaeon]|nr:DUF2606 family protein [Halobacteriota archaeon]
MKLKKTLIATIVIVMLLATPAMALLDLDGQISGRITTPTGEPVPDALVTFKRRATDEEFTATTDANGSFNIDLPSGVYKITYTYEGKKYTYAKAEVVTSGINASIDIELSEKILSKVDTFEIESLKIKALYTADVGENVVIKVMDRETGEAVENVDVYISGIGGTIGKKEASVVIEYGEILGKTDAEGEVTHIFNKSGKYLIAARKDEYISDVEDITVTKDRYDSDEGDVSHVKDIKHATRPKKVEFNTSNSSILGYSVKGTEFFSSLDVDSNITIGKKTGVKTRLISEDMSISTHNNANGLLKLKADEDTTVTIEISESATVDRESDRRITVRSDGMEGTLMIAGQGNLTVENDTIIVNLEAHSQLIFKAYPGEKDDGDEAIEDGIISGNLSAEVQIISDGEDVSDTVEYSEDVVITEVDTTEDNVSVTVESTTEIGKTIVVTINNSELSTDPSGLSVKIDGESTMKVNSTEELYTDGEESKYFIVEGMDDTKVFIYVNHFSERVITVEGVASTPSTTTPETAVSSETSSDIPGFEAVFAIVGLLSVAYILRRR